jgi:anti-anti-sigma factor
MSPVRRVGEDAVIVLPAEIDVTNADQVGAELMQALDASAVMLVVDMTETVFCDSRGVQMLLRAHRQATAAGMELRVATSSRSVRRVLELTGTDRVIDMYPDLSAAMNRAAGTG